LIKRFLKASLKRLGYRIQNTKYILEPFLDEKRILSLNFDHVLCKYLVDSGEFNNFKFIQVGAFDGVAFDPLRKYLVKYDWEGILLEPQPLPYQSLKLQYDGRSHLKIVNAAVNRQNGKADLFFLEGEGLPKWTKGLASFHKSNILKHESLFKDLGTYLKCIEVETISFETLLDRFEWTRLDLLQVDAEGFDAEIIKMFPFDRLKPAIIHFESKHIQKAELESLLDILMQRGYLIAKDKGEDMIALLDTQSVTRQS